eukprot:gene290-162_t
MTVAYTKIDHQEEQELYMQAATSECSTSSSPNLDPSGDTRIQKENPTRRVLAASKRLAKKLFGSTTVKKNNVSTFSLEELAARERATKAEFMKYFSRCENVPFEKKESPVGHYPGWLEMIKNNTVDPLIGLFVQLIIPFVLLILKFIGLLFSIFGFSNLNQEHIKYEYVNNKRIVVSGGGGLLYYQAGFCTVLVELYQKHLAEGVTFEGYSAGASASLLLAWCSQGVGSVAEYTARTLDSYYNIPNYMNSQYNAFNCHADVWLAAKIWHDKASEKLSDDETLESKIKDRLVIWVTNAFTMKSVPLFRFPDVRHLADAWVASCFIPGFLSPWLWYNHSTPHASSSIDGGFGIIDGDNSMFEAKKTKDGKRVKTIYIETFPTPWKKNSRESVDPNIRIIQLWKWEDYDSSSFITGLIDPTHQTDLFLRGYYSSKKHVDEIHEAMSWLLAEDDDDDQ